MDNPPHSKAALRSLGLFELCVSTFRRGWGSGTLVAEPRG